MRRFLSGTMKLELMSYAICPYVHRATTLLHEKNAPFEVTYIDLGDRPASFKAISPRGKVPVLVVDGTPVFESMVIAELVDELFPPRWLPSDPLERARQRSWFAVADDLFAAQFKLTTAKSADDAAKARRTLEELAGRFADALRGPFFAGHDFGLVDVAVAPAFHRFGVLEDARHPAAFSFRAFPRVEAWGRALAARPSVRAGVPADFAARYLGYLRERAAA